MWILSIIVALACTGDTEARVVGWKADGSIVVRTLDTIGDGEEAPTDLWLATYAPGKTDPTKRWTIQGPEDSQADRGANWTAAEKELISDGYLIVPEAPMVELDDTSFKGVTLSTGMIYGEYIKHTHIFAHHKAMSVVLEPPIHSCCFGGNAASKEGPWRPADGQWLVYVGQGCGMSGAIGWYDLESAARQLGAG